MKDFRSEYLEQIEIAGEGAFEAGLLFPAIPLIFSSELGRQEIAHYISKIVLPSVSEI